MSEKQTSGHCRWIPLTVFLAILFCCAAASAATASAVTTAACPSGCSCMQPAAAQEKGYDACGGQLAACGYDVFQKTMYCYKTPQLSIPVRTLQTLVIATTTQPGTCPADCSCMMEAEAKEKFGTYSRCSETPCYTVNTGSTSLKAYCFRQGTPPTTTPAPACPSPCECMAPGTAIQRFGANGYKQCSDTPCGNAPTTTAYIPYYCYSPITTTTLPVCPDECSCISNATAQARGGTWIRCTNDVCGYEQSTATLAAVIQVPKYCMKQQETAPVCPEGCTCLTDAQAKERYGTFTRCSADVCGYQMSAPTNALASGQIPKYCVKQGTTPVCPDGCACISDEDAKLKGLTERCDNSQTPCGYKTAATTSNQRIPLYCYKIPKTAPVCQEGCYCRQVAEADLEFGPNNYTRCQAEPCGYDPSATTANGIPKYCFKPTVTTTSPVCPQGCGCMTNATGVEKGLSFCGGKLISCGYDQNKQPLYCFGEAATPSCAYDYQKNVCTGTCQQGYSCTLAASRKDESGKVVYAACRCTGQQATPCGYDSQKGECTGVCQIGKTCVITGKETDKQTGKETPVCGCPWNTCTYDYDKNSCTGSCPVSGENCQLNTIYRDPASGKVTFADCNCKGGGITGTCACDATSGSCTGNCADGRACTMVERTTDNAGKFVCSKCECRDSCVMTANNECSGTCVTGAPCTRIVYKDDSGNEKAGCGCGGISPAGASTTVTPVRQQGFLGGFFDFFNKLFGGK